MTDEPPVPRVVVDRERCLGNGLCESMAPGVFRVDDDGKVELIDPAPGPELDADLDQAVRLCPTQAISVVR